jgi:hypothetical protein
VLTKTKEPIIEEHSRGVEPENLKCTLASMTGYRAWPALSGRARCRACWMCLFGTVLVSLAHAGESGRGAMTPCQLCLGVKKLLAELLNCFQQGVFYSCKAA